MLETPISDHLDFEMISTLHIPTEISFGAGSISRFRLPKGRVLLIFGSAMSADVKEYLDQVDLNGTELLELKKPGGEPFSASIDSVCSTLPGDLVAVLGIGGGSVMDFAKAVALVNGSGGQIAEYEFGGRKIKRIIPLYFAPTTCGSGSEVTPYCVIKNSQTGRKFTLSNPAFRSVQTAIDPELLRNLPDSARLATALDAFTHCLEAVLTRGENTLVRPIAEAGLALGWKTLGRAAQGDSAPELLAKLAQLSLYGGISIAHSRTGLIHTMSVAFAEFCDLPHGLLNARLLPYALSHNLSGYGGLLKFVVQRFTGESVETDEEAFERLTCWLSGLIGSAPPAPAVEIRARRDAIVRRMGQDSGLPGVSHGAINIESLTSLIERVADASR